MGLAVAILLALQRAPEDMAVRKAVEAIKTANLAEHREFALWTLVDVQVPPSDPVVRKLLEEVLSKPVETTKSAALQAMILGSLDPYRHRPRIADCAQFLIDNQTLDGRWDAGRPVDPLELPAPKAPPPPLPGPRAFAAPKPVLEKLVLSRRRDGPARGDPANARWAALGLQACHLAAIRVPEEVSIRAEAAWRGADADAADVVSCLSIHLSLQNKKWTTDPGVLKAFQRLADPERPKNPQSLAALKRAMFHYGSETLGGRKWWPEGMKTLLDSQSPDGSWGGIEDTCAAARYLHLYRVSLF